MADEPVICPYCQCEVAPEDDCGECQSCNSTYHLECWEENGGCAVYGCDDMAEVEKLDETEIPVSFWGQEHKKCPRCKEQILAAAVRCKKCGAEFQSSRPMNSREYHSQQIAKSKVPAAKKTVLILFVACVLPCLGLFGAIGMGGWWLLNGSVYKELPALQRALVIIGIIIGILTTVGMAALSAAVNVMH